MERRWLDVGDMATADQQQRSARTRTLPAAGAAAHPTGPARRRAAAARREAGSLERSHRHDQAVVERLRQDLRAAEERAGRSARELAAARRAVVEADREMEAAERDWATAMRGQRTASTSGRATGGRAIAGPARRAGDGRADRDGRRATPAGTAEPRPAGSRTGLSAALAGLETLMEHQVVARYGKRQRSTRLARGRTYRIVPLNPAKKKDRGRVGVLMGWNLDGLEGMVSWKDDGDKALVDLRDLEEVR